MLCCLSYMLISRLEDVHMLARQQIPQYKLYIAHRPFPPEKVKPNPDPDRLKLAGQLQSALYISDALLLVVYVDIRTWCCYWRVRRHELTNNTDYYEFLIICCSSHVLRCRHQKGAIGKEEGRKFHVVNTRSGNVFWFAFNYIMNYSYGGKLCDFELLACLMFK